MTKTHIYGQLIFDKEPDYIKWSKDILFKTCSRKME